MDIACSYLQAVFLVKSEREWDKGREIIVQKITFTLDLETQMDRCREQNYFKLSIIMQVLISVVIYWHRPVFLLIGAE